MKKFGLLFTCLLVSLSTLACGPIGELLTTPTPTSTPTPTVSPTPTYTPTPESPPVPAGWVTYYASNFSLALPERWEAVDVDEEGAEVLMDALEALDTEWAQNLRAMFSSGAALQYLKFWARDTELVGISFAAVSATRQTFPAEVDAATLAEQSASLHEQLGIEVLGIEQGLEINGLDAARLEIRVEVEPFVARQYHYVFVRGREAWVLTCVMDETAWSEYEPIFVDIAETFAAYEE